MLLFLVVSSRLTNTYLYVGISVQFYCPSLPVFHMLYGVVFS